MKRALVALVVLGLAVACLATGWVEVAPGEVVVVRRLGRVVPAPWMPGPHLGLPLGLDRRIARPHRPGPPPRGRPRRHARARGRAGRR